MLIKTAAVVENSIIKPMDNTRGWILVIGILAIIAAIGAGMIWIVRDTLNTSISPVQSMTGDLGTRVAQVLNPTPTILPDPITILREIRSLARLETVQYSIEKVITAETKQEPFGILFGDRLLFVAHGKVIAGIDLEKIGPDDLWIDNDVLYVKLPAPEVFIAALESENSYVYDRDKGLLTKGDIHLETEARKAAEVEIEKAAEEDGILNLAGKNAENYLYSLFRQLGYPEVIFVDRESSPSD